MSKASRKRVSSWDGIWAIIDVFVNILTLVVVVSILAKTMSGWALTFMIGVFIIWAFRPFGKLFKNLIG